jgi:Protein of unknown function (DUF1634)
VSGDRKPASGLERCLATTLQLGTWVGSCTIAVGWVLSATGGSPSLSTASVAIVRAGIAVFILLPALRVLLMAVVFVCEHDYRFAAIAALVLAVIVVAAALGVRMAGVVPG